MNTELGSPAQYPRRDFLRWVIRGSATLIGLVVAVPGVGMLLNPLFARVRRLRRKVVFTGPAQQLSSTFVPARFEGQSETEPGIFVKQGPDGKPVVLSAKCTHAGCAVQWKPDQNEFVCPCHNGHFDTAGKNVSGPPPAPLPRIPAEEVNGQVYVEVAEG